MYKPKILVVQRKSHVSSDIGFSRSVSARVCEPLDYLVAQDKLTYDMVDENAIDETDLKFDAIIFSKHLSNQSIKIADHANKKKIKVIYDIDDVILAFPDYSGAQITSAKKKNFFHHIELADHISIATPRLMESMREVVGNNAKVVTNGFNVERHYKCLSDDIAQRKKIIYTNADRIKLDSFRDGFIKTINQFFEKNTQYTFNMFSDFEEDARNFSKINFLGSVDWFEHKKQLLLGKYYMGIVPLGGKEDQQALKFNACKSPFKYLEYGGLKIPGIYSRSPIYTDIIEDRYNGLLVENTADEWRNAMEELVDNKDLHKKIAQNAFDDVVENHHVSIAAKQWYQLIRD